MFSFSNVSFSDVKKEIRKLDPRKATQHTDIPVRISKQNSDVFGNYICDFLNECVDMVFSLYSKKCENYTCFKKVLVDQKTITDRLVYFQLSL